MKFNVDAFKAIRSGSGLSSPTLGKTASMISGFSSAEGALQNLKSTSFDATRISQMETLLANSKTSGNSFSTHASQQMGDMVGTMGMSAAVKEVEAVADNVPPSCSDMNAVLGSVTGAVDGVLDTVLSKCSELVSAIGSYIAGSMNDSDLSALFDAISNTISSSMASLLEKINSENSLLSELRQIHRQFADASALDGLSKDPCAKALIEKTAHPDLLSALGL